MHGHGIHKIEHAQQQSEQENKYSHIRHIQNRMRMAEGIHHI